MINRQAVFEWVLIWIGFVALLATLHPVVGGDGLERFASMQGLMGDGSSLSKYSLVQPVLSLPLARLADLFGAERVTLVAYFNVALFGVFSIFIYHEIATKYSSRIGRVWLLLMGGASMFPHHLQNYYGEVLTSLFVFLAVLWVDRRPLASTLLLGLGCANTPVLLPPLLGFSVFWFLLNKQKVPLLAFMVALVLVAVEMWFERSGAIRGYLSDSEHGFKTILPYSGQPGFSYPMILGLLSIFFSLGKGLFFFIPALFLGFSGRLRAEIGLTQKGTVLAVLGLVLPMLMYSKWWAWYGGSFWGPRFFLFMCAPACLLLAVGLFTRERDRNDLIWMLLALLLSSWVAIDGYVFGQGDMDVCWSDNYLREYLCWYVPEFSALWRPFVNGHIWNLFADQRWPFAVWNFVVVSYLAVASLSLALSTGVASTVRDGRAVASA